MASSTSDSRRSGERAIGPVQHDAVAVLEEEAFGLLARLDPQRSQSEPARTLSDSS